MLRPHQEEGIIHTKQDFYAVVMAGGRGTRFWPLSRSDRPKQLLKLFSRKTLLEETIARILPLIPPDNVFVVTGQALRGAVIEAVKTLLPRSNVIAEPASCNTSPAIALATAHIRRAGKNAILAVLPSDHLIEDGQGFLKLLEKAYQVARSAEHGLVTLGIRPEYPETGYGYIERGAPFDGGERTADVYSVRAFKEKPDQPTAEEFVRSGRYYWNSGMFVWSVGAYEANLEQADPELYALYRDVVEARNPPRRITATAALYKKARPTSIDYALLEKSRSVYVVEASIGWNDIGSWLSLEKLLPRDADDIYYNCRIVSDASGHSLAFAPGKLVALVGVSDLIVVDTPDALLVCRRDRSQDVKKIVERLGRLGMGRYL